jgi:hypothetical protein
VLRGPCVVYIGGSRPGVIVSRAAPRQPAVVGVMLRLIFLTSLPVRARPFSWAQHDRHQRFVSGRARPGRMGRYTAACSPSSLAYDDTPSHTDAWPISVHTKEQDLRPNIPSLWRASLRDGTRETRETREWWLAQVARVSRGIGAEGVPRQARRRDGIPALPPSSVVHSDDARGTVARY